MNQVFSRERKTTNEKLIEGILLEKYNSYYRMALSYTKNEADAADIVQEGAYRAIRMAGSLKDPKFASTWIYRIMMNEIYRTMSRAGATSLDAIEYEGEGHEDKYRDTDLERVLDSLDKKDQAVIKLRYFEEMTLQEIARILDENENTVKSRLYRSLKKLRAKMEESGYDR